MNEQLWVHMPPDAHANAPRDNTRPQPDNQAAASRVVLHPLRGAAPVTWCCTRCVALHPNRAGAMPTDWVQCPRIGCTALPDRTTAELGIPQHERRRPKRPYTQTRTRPQAAASRVVLHPLRGAAPVTWRCTRTERVQCLRIGCNARGSGVRRSQIRTSVEPGIPQREGKRHKLPYTQPGTWQANQGGDITRGAAPEQNGCNAYGSGVMPADRVYGAPR